MDNVSKTLYIPLYGKAYVSRKGILLKDKMAEEIWQREGFPLKGKAASKWLAYHMGMRAKVFDAWIEERLAEQPHAVVLHIGCGLDSRSERVDRHGREWFDIDFPEVIAERRKYFREGEGYHLLSADIREQGWEEAVPGGRAIVVMEGISMYLQPKELLQLLQRLRTHFEQMDLLMDCYTTFGAKATKYKNPINEVGVTVAYGMDDPKGLADAAGFAYVAEHSLTPAHLIAQLPNKEQGIFRALFAGKFARKLYRLYEFKKA